MVHGRTLSTLAITFLAILLAFGQALTVGADQAEPIVQPASGQEEQASDELVTDDVAEIPAGEAVQQPEVGEQSTQDDPVAIERAPDETGELSEEAAGSSEDSVTSAAEHGPEPAASDADVSVAGEVEGQTQPDGDEASLQEASIDEPETGVAAPHTSAPAETGASLDSMQSTQIQQVPDTQMEVAASTLSVSDLVLTCDGSFSFFVAEGSSGAIGFGIGAVLSDGTTSPIHYGTTGAYTPGTTMTMSFTPRADAMAYVAALVDWASDTPIGEVRSADCSAAPATLAIMNATCDGVLTASVSEGTAPGGSVVGFFYAYGLDPDGWTQEAYDLRLAQDISGSGEYAFQFAVDGYPAELDPVTVEVAVAFYDGDRAVGEVAAQTLDCTGATTPDDQDPGLATIEIVEATCDGSATIRISEGDFVADLVNARLFGLKTDGDAVGLLQEEYVTYTGPGEYEVSFELPRFDIEVQPETFIAVYSFSNLYTGQIIEASLEVPDCPNPWHVPVEEPQDEELLTIGIVDATCDGRAVIHMANGDEGDHDVTASVGIMGADSQLIDGYYLEQVVPYTGAGDYVINFELQMLDIDSLPETFMVGYGFLGEDAGQSIEAGRVLDLCARKDLLPSVTPAPSPDVDPVETLEPVQLVASAPDPAPEPVQPQAPASGGVTALPSTGDGAQPAATTSPWMVLAGMALLTGALATGMRRGLR